MLSFDVALLARAQFAFTVAVHIIFPAFSIGLASYLATLEGLWLLTGRSVYLSAFRYWLRVFALVFGMGVVSGIVMSYQFGTNWSVFADKTGPVLGPLIGYEVFTAFFLEAGFLGVMMFGLERVGKGLHFLATLLVAGGTLFSAFWILSVNSWMQTPVGYAMNAAGQFVVDDWMTVIFNPSFLYRLVHMVLAAYLTTAFVVGGVSAWHLLRNHANEPARLMFSMAMWMALIVTPIQIAAGDLHGLNTLAYQPAKVAAMEGHFETERAAPLILFGLPDMERAETAHQLALPGWGSFILTHDWNGEVRGLKVWPREEWPNVPIVFWAFRIMTGLGLLMLALGVWALFNRLRRALYGSRAMLRFAVLMGPSGFLAVLAGWTVTEVGRQPYVVYGLLRTADAISPVGSVALGASLAAFAVIYFAVFGAGAFYALRLMAKTPQLAEPGLEHGVPSRAAGITPMPAILSEMAPPQTDSRKE